MSSVAQLETRGHPGGAIEPLDVERIREDFPILKRRIHDKPLVYLDNAASSQRPRAVIDRVKRLYEEDYANIHRGVHTLSQRSTEAYEATREKVRALINAAQTREIIFVRGTTEAINLVAHSYGRRHIKAGDEILITHMEHHSNIVPWQMLCEQTGASLVVGPISDQGALVMSEFEKLIGPRTRLVAFVHLSNALGTINPTKAIIKLAHERGVPVLIDGAQAVPHLKVDVRDLDCDFYAFSGHKLYGPSGIGVLYGKAELLEAMPPYQGGGEMINSVTFEKTTYSDLPNKFEAGTPNIAGGVGLGTAIDYVTEIGLDRIAAHENELLAHATRAVGKVPGVRIIGTAPCKASVLSFTMDCAHPHDLGTVLDQEGIAVRTGHHCAQPTMERFGVPATARASFAFYNTKQEIDALVGGLHKVIEVFG